jgi:nicotinamide riboside transporter PnuC
MDVLNYVVSTDNDGHPPTVWTRPATQQPMRVKIGTMTVTYVAVDASRHKTKCNFTITVEGNKSVFIFCVNFHIIRTTTTIIFAISSAALSCHCQSYYHQYQCIITGNVIIITMFFGTSEDSVSVTCAS